MGILCPILNMGQTASPSDKGNRNFMIRINWKTVAAVGVFIFTATSAQSAVYPAAGGQAWSGNDVSCFDRVWGRVRNTCDSLPNVRLFTIGTPAIVGARNFRATGCSVTHETRCAAVITDSTGWSTWWTGLQHLGTCGSPVLLGTGSVTSSSGVVFECQIHRDQSLQIYSEYVGTVEY